ncbi:MAG: CheY-like chemotaxis protein [Planctomycetota bacterium]|jgi:CheY-like chemotaxis protein
MEHRILIADDDADVRQGAAELLVRQGLEVMLAGDGEEAICLVRRSLELGKPLHLVLVDVHMPPPMDAAPISMDGEDGGLALFSLLRGSRPELPCILWSGEASQGVESWAMREGASAFLRKPVKPLKLREEIQRVLKLHWGAAG